MIAREWKGRVPPEHRQAFIGHLHGTGVREAMATPGCLGAQILWREAQGKSVITLVTYWDELKSIEAFAGADIHRVRLYPEDQAFGLDPDLAVTLSEVVWHEFVPGQGSSSGEEARTDRPQGHGT